MAEQNPLIGRKIVDVRRATESEKEKTFFNVLRTPTVLVLDDGTRIIPSSDAEGNNVIIVLHNRE